MPRGHWFDSVLGSPGDRCNRFDLDELTFESKRRNAKQGAWWAVRRESLLDDPPDRHEVSPLPDDVHSRLDHLVESSPISSQHPHEIFHRSDSLSYVIVADDLSAIIEWTCSCGEKECTRCRDGSVFVRNVGEQPAVVT